MTMQGNDNEEWKNKEKWEINLYKILNDNFVNTFKFTQFVI